MNLPNCRRRSSILCDRPLPIPGSDIKVSESAVFRLIFSPGDNACICCSDCLFICLAAIITCSACISGCVTHRCMVALTAINMSITDSRAMMPILSVRLKDMYERKRLFMIGKNRNLILLSFVVIL